MNKINAQISTQRQRSHQQQQQIDTNTNVTSSDPYQKLSGYPRGSIRSNISISGGVKVSSGIQDLIEPQILQQRQRPLMANVFNGAVEDIHDGRFEDAIDKFGKCIQKNYQTFNSMKMRSEAYFFSSKFDSAANSYQQMIQKFPNNAVGYYGKAFAIQTQGSRSQSQQLYKKALHLQQKNPKIYFCKGYTTLKKRDYQKCLQLFEQSRTKNSLNDPLTLIAAAQIFCHRRNFEACHKYIAYANKAIEDEENHKLLYRFQVRAIKEGLKKYGEMVDKIQRAQINKKIDTKTRQQLQFDMTRSLNKGLVLNKMSIFDCSVLQVQEKLNHDARTDTTNFTSASQQTSYENSQAKCNCTDKCTIF